MYKIAILGTENSHSWAFSKAILGGRRPELELVGVYGDEESNQTLAEKTGFDFSDKIMNHYNDLVGKVDGIMITAAHGGNHLKYAEEYIKNGVKAVWVDKPFTASAEDARKLTALCKEYNVPICGGSMLAVVKDTKELRKAFLDSEFCVGGAVSAPVSMKNDKGNFWFYSGHLVEIMLEVFGYDVKSVVAHRSKLGVSAIYRYENFDVTAVWYESLISSYYGTVYSEKYASRDIDYAGGDEALMDEFIEMLHTGKSAYTLEQMAKKTFVLDAVVKSLENNETWVEIENL